jgi:hypothetical protein
MRTSWEEKFRYFQSEARAILEDVIKSLKEIEFCWQCYDNVEHFGINIYDHDWVNFYILAQLEEIKRPKEGDKMKEDFIYRFIALSVVKDRLKEMNISHLYYYKRQPFEEPYEDSFDFAIQTKDGKIITLEVVHIPPDYYKSTCKERSIVKNFIMPEREWKKCDYAIGVKILEIGVKDNSIIGKGAIVGYLSKEEIERIPIRRKGEYPCIKFDGRPTIISELNQPKKLWDILEERAITLSPKV